jgi:hypothetical protein
VVSQRLRLGVIRDEHNEAYIARKPHFCTDGNGKPPDQSETATPLDQLAADGG